MMTNDDMKVSWWIYLFVLLGTAMKIGNASELRVASNITWPSDGICPSIDVRTSIDNFVKLRGCHVIEGNLHILLIEKVNETQYANISFPELTEITGFLLLYRVSGLVSLSRLFPNLAVIRGQSIIFNYAFAVYEMSHLQDIGLISLTHIERGAVYIAKNSNLCFVNTIDWDRITLKGKGGNFITQNKPENECPMCPGDEKVNEFDGEILKECPVRYTNEEKSPQNARHLCWNRKHCQKVCPDGCKACNSRSECCSELCLSSCSDNDPTNCTVCQFFATGKMCAKTCPVNTVKFMNRRCVDEDTCRKIKKPKEADPSITTNFHKPHDGICLLDCPSNYSEGYENDKLVCKKCNGTCHIDCPGRKVDSIRAAQSLHGCTHILGSLEIQIRGGGENIVNELDANLKDIIEIKGYLKIVRSFPIVSLSFLRSLQVIRGDVLDSNRYSFIVMDNPNLQELWNFNSSSGERKFKIEKGRLCFHYNSKLCYSKIEQLRIAAGLNKSLDLEVDRKSNGEKTACTVSNLDVEMDPQADGIILKWKPFKMDEYRHLLGYVVYWIESPTRNLSLYESRDACDDDSWQVDDAKSGDNDTEYIYHPLTRLKPYTQYAFYVKTYTVATEESGAHSQIYYFRTFPGKPTSVVNLDATSNASHVFVSWLPPHMPNGNLTHYVVTVRLKTDDAKLSEERNYCNVPITKEPPKQKYIEQEKPDTCSCKEKKVSTDNTKPFRNGLRDEKNVLLQKSFEDELHNLIYVKRIPLPNNVNNRQKREVVTSDNFYQNSLPIASYFSTNESGSVWTFNHTSTNCVLKDLHHFSEYTISIKACRERHERDKGNDSCSDDSFVTVRTRPLPNADDIKSFRTSVQTSNESLGMIRLEWDEPVDPNGVILTYRIEYKKLSNENLQPTIECITRKKHSEAKNSYTIMNLSPGNYSVRLMATSLRGDGGYTSFQYVYIEAVDKNHTAEVIGLIFGIVVVMVSGIFIGTILYLRRNYMRGVPNMKLIASVNPEYVSTAYVPDDWEVPRKKIELLRELGQGSFGMVYEGVARDVVRGYPEMRCAIKTVNEHATDRERIEFLNEASVMKAFDTQHVVRLLGVVSQGQPTLVVMELMANGDLKSYLRSHRPEEQDPNNPRKESPPSLKRILQMAIEIADGMAYLTAKKFVHRDLAARNCMVSENLTVKIGDFGMTRDIYETDYYRKGTKGLLPVRWMAPESLKDGVFTSSSDVWSYGVVLWEMATLASQPYQGLSNDQVLRYVVDGGIMERPENCPDKLYDLMRRCWQHKSSARPTFLGLATMLLPDASQEFRQGAFYFTKIGQEALAAQSTQQVEEAEATTPLRPAVDNDDDFSIDDSCSDRDELTDGENTAVVSEARYPAPYRTAAYRDAAPGSSLPAANGYVLGCPANNGVGNVKITEC